MHLFGILQSSLLVGTPCSYISRVGLLFRPLRTSSYPREPLLLKARWQRDASLVQHFSNLIRVLIYLKIAIAIVTEIEVTFAHLVDEEGLPSFTP